MFVARVLGLIFTVVVAACDNSVPSSVTSTTKSAAFEVFSPPNFNPIYEGPNEPLFAVLRATSEWEQLWSQIGARTTDEQGRLISPPLPTINFGEHALVVAAIGKKGYGCCSVLIKSIEGRSKLLITVMITKLGSGCTTTQSEIRPVAFALIPATPKSAEFAIIEEVRDCR